MLLPVLLLFGRGAPVAAAGPHAKKRPTIRLALTIDDLPAAPAAVPSWSKARILDALTETLSKHHVPGAVGFLNGSNMDDDPGTREALARWLSRGFVLGNHTFSHESAYTMVGSALLRDIERNQQLIVELGQRDTGVSKYFRYPYLERGTVREQRELLSYLARHRYRIADVSVDFQDWDFSAAYVRCQAQGDARARDALGSSYLIYARAQLLWAVESARRILGRSIPHVLMVHANAMTAQLLDALLSDYEALGVKFISLDEALDDPAYRTAQTSRHGDTTLIPALMRERRAHIGSSVPLPANLIDALCQ